jgi:NADPH:quinone reductase-like Zn-dependent oxidoreductase
VNGHDVIVRSGGLRIVIGSRFPMGIGLDFAGVVAATGADVSAHRVGDRVWGTVHPRQRHTIGAAAEYVVVTADRIGPAPQSLASVEAAGLVVAGTTALIALRDTARLSSGERVLIRGAAGGVGTAAVQLAHAFDVILDTVGTDLGRYRGKLAKGGRMVTVGLSARALVTVALSTVYGSSRIRTFSANPDAHAARSSRIRHGGHAAPRGGQRLPAG